MAHRRPLTDNSTIHMTIDTSPYIISQEASTLDALRQLNDLSGKAMTLFATDRQHRVTGTLTDGDIRRSLIAGAQLTTPVRDIMHRHFAAFRGEAPQIAEIREIRARRITLVPHLNADGTLRRLYDFSVYHSILPIDAVLMAGGKGERLRPMTLDTPTPLLKIGGKCIIDYNIEALARNGVTNISVTVNYLAEKLQQHFARPVAGVQVKCVKEPCRLGTIGSLTLVDDLTSDTVLLMNSDLLTNVSFEEMFIAHCEAEADLTVAVIPYMVSVPYAIFRTEGNDVRGLEEKPTYNYYANAGIYMIKRSRLEIIPRGEYYDATDFLDALIARGCRVRQFPISGTWIDIGSPDDFRAAQDLVARSRFTT